MKQKLPNSDIDMSSHACCYKNGRDKCIVTCSIVTIISKIFFLKKMSYLVHEAPTSKGSRLGGTYHPI